MEWARDLLFLVYFLSHIPLTIVFDSQIILPKWLYPQQVLDVMENYVQTYKDPLVGQKPYWFQAFCVCELVLQLPFCFVATYVIWTGISRHRWFRLPTILYSCHVITSMIPIYFHIFLEDFSKDAPPGPSKFQERCTVALFYLPYLTIPSVLLVDSLFSPIYLKSNIKSSKKQH